MAVAEFVLVIDKNQDDSVPHHRAESIWAALYAKGLISIPFCARKWAACREVMVRHGIVVLTDREYHHGKAMKWALGPYFPFLGAVENAEAAVLAGTGVFQREIEKDKTRTQYFVAMATRESGSFIPLGAAPTASCPACRPPAVKESREMALEEAHERGGCVHEG